MSMDEITMFAELRPDRPAEAEAGTMQAAARSRLTGAIRAAQAPLRRTRPSRPVLLACGAIAAAAAAAIVVPATLPAGTGGSFVTKAWAVQREPDGTIKITIEQEFSDPAGLERALRAEGIRADVREIPILSATVNGSPEEYMGCQYLGLNLEPTSIQQAVLGQIGSRGRTTAWTVRPSAMPAGSAMFIQVALSNAVSMASVPVVLKSETLPPCTPAGPAG
jgi:hypothetical protein